MHKANKYGLASLCNLDRLPPKGAILIAAPLKIEHGTGSPIARAGAGAEGAERRRSEASPMSDRPTTSSSAAASTRWSARRCSPARARKVLVLERNDRIGGCIRTEEITAPGFVHDVMATTFVLFITSPAYAALGRRSRPPRAGILPHRHADRRAPARRQPSRPAHGPAGQHRGLQRAGSRRRRPIWPRCRRDRAAMPACCSACSAAACGPSRPSSCSPARPGGAGRAGSPPSSARR